MSELTSTFQEELENKLVELLTLVHSFPTQNDSKSVYVAKIIH